MDEHIDKLINENASPVKECNLCKEAMMEVGEKTGYNATIIFKIGQSKEDGWFATLSPKSGGDPKNDFSIQLMSLAHLTHFCQIGNYPKLAENYGIAFSKICAAMTRIMAIENPDFGVTSESRKEAVSVATYGKCTNWKEKKEHLHIKIFPFRGAIGQPYTVDSSFGRKEIQKDTETGQEFVKMEPVKKTMLDKERFEKLSRLLISLLK